MSSEISLPAHFCYLQNIPGIQNIHKLPNQFQASQRNSNLRELPIAPHNSTTKQHRPLSAPAAQATTVSWSKSTASSTTTTRMNQTAQGALVVQPASGERMPPKILQQKNKKQKPVSQDSTVGEVRISQLYLPMHAFKWR